MDETKKVLRSLLVSSPLVLTVMKLNNDYKEVTGYNIPYKDLGYRTLLDLLHDIPDVLTVDGNSLNADVTLVVSDKISHVNDMVLRQKKGKSRYGFHPSQGRIVKKKFERPPRFEDKKSAITSPKNCINEACLEDSQYCSLSQSQGYNLKYNSVTPTNQKNISCLRSNIIESREYINSKITVSPEGQICAPETLKKELRRAHCDNNTYNNVLSEKDTKLKKCENTANNGTNTKETHLLRRLNYAQGSCSGAANIIPSLFDIKFNEDELLNLGKGDFMRQLVLQKCSSTDGSSTLIDDKKSKTKYIEHASKIPKDIQDDLKKLIEGFSEGVWCSKLPEEYRKKFRKELRFEKLGYRCLINMCLDLENIFHCVKESTYDFKLYNAENPIPNIKITEDNQLNTSKYSDCIPAEEMKALPPLDWSAYAQLFPEDIIGHNFEIPRDFVSETEVKSDVFHVVVAEIYDPSKFWLYRNDGRLDALMNEMQQFYKINSERYRIPVQHLEIGLYCAAVTLKEYHRCVIVKMQPNVSFVNVFYIDYGSLGTVPKGEIWFLTKNFSRLPAQAIRARLANVYPPVEFSMWSTKARSRFQELADMKQLEAHIMKVLSDKKVINVCLENSILAPGKDISSILVDEGLALYANQVRKMNIHDPNCTPRVKFVHLFPDFEEIEYWLAPSVEEMAWFSNTALTPDFYFPQYFSRPIDKNFHNKIEIKAMKLVKRKEKPVEYIDVEELKTIGNMEDIFKVSYGDLYNQYKNKLMESVQQCSQYLSTEESERKLDEVNELNLTANCVDYETLLSKLRGQVLDSAVPHYNTGGPLTWHMTKSTENSFSTANKEKDNKETMCKMLDSCSIDSSRSATFSRQNNPKIEKYRNQLDNLVDLCELEKYLSQDDPSTSPQSNSALIDVDLFDSCNLNGSSPKNTLLDLKVLQSRSVSKRHRKTRSLLLSESSSSDELESRDERSYHNSSRQRNDSVCSDLIQLDVVLDCPILTPQIVGQSNATSAIEAVESLSSAADDDAFNWIPPKLSKSSDQQNILPKRENIGTNRDNLDLVISPESSPRGAQSPLNRLASIESTSQTSPTGILQHIKMAHQPYALGACAGSKSPLDNTPNTARRLLPSTTGTFQPKYTVYQPWSLSDCVGSNKQPDFLRNNMITPTEGISLTPQDFFASASGITPYPIVVFSYVNPLLVQPPMNFNRGVMQQYPPIKHWNNYWNLNR